mmetsp:Transcript_36835/g.42844  ORF Transcript_36835/g.42844 Transcript_36835/m.42844 type:complete len:402 (-) Transcript_36835:85-1290(-)|eukprot:CAMPEP_0194418972 /NCGR_PEP_ID=MMETSP0176-20130528/18184_1 /TAXON_ID=216777 /ORGANISM="Proboscia alata, Strain PI-D3" /LENGTH=401 /DNA_ID=CAMNT_0039225751 /DNA_START=24 /DNA_END=1229 /DNA_ORIENTATION=-
MYFVDLLFVGVSLQLLTAPISYAFVSTSRISHRISSTDGYLTNFAIKENQDGETSEHSSDRRTFVSILASSAAIATAFGPTDNAFADLEVTRDNFRSPERIEARRAKLAQNAGADTPEAIAAERARSVIKVPEKKVVAKSKVPPKAAPANTKKADKEKEILVQKTSKEDARRIEEEAAKEEAIRLAKIEEMKPPAKPRILVLGGTGAVGKEVRKKLQELDVFVIATSRDGRDDTIALDAVVKKAGLKDEIKNIANKNKITGVISCIGAIDTPTDSIVNGASGVAAIGAKEANFVKNFVFISISPEVRKKAAKKNEHEEYFAGKLFSEQVIQTQFGADGFLYTLIEPSSIGKTPQVTGAGDSIPAEVVANAAIVGALGKSDEKTLDSKKKIEGIAKKISEAV